METDCYANPNNDKIAPDLAGSTVYVDETQEVNMDVVANAGR